jgi:hypothetical protein
LHPSNQRNQGAKVGGDIKCEKDREHIENIKDQKNIIWDRKIKINKQTK